MTHYELFDYVLDYLEFVPEDDRTNVEMLARSALGQFHRMQPGQEFLFHSSWNELCAAFLSCQYGWMRQTLQRYLHPDSAVFDSCLFLLHQSYSDGDIVCDLWPQSTGLKHRLAIHFPLSFLNFRKAQ